MRRAALISAALALCAMPAKAAVTVERHMLQKGYFVNAACRSLASQENQTDADEGWDECGCEANISYPQITGLADIGAQAALNLNFKHAAEQSECKGAEAVKPATAVGGKPRPTPSSMEHHYEVTFQSPHLLGLVFKDWGYMGGAHGNGAVEGMIIDLDKARALSIDDIIAAKDIAAVNRSIYTALSAKPEEEVFRDQVESRKDAFLKDGNCERCTVTLTPDGISVVFQTYEVAPYSSGNISVPVPAAFIRYPALKEALSGQAHVSSHQPAVSEKP